MQLLSVMMFSSIALTVLVVIIFNLDVQFSSLALALSYGVLCADAYSELFNMLIGFE